MKTVERDQIGHTYFELTNYIDFYSEELTMLKRRLDEICSKNTSKELLVSLEQFENRFNVQQSNLRELKNLIQNNLKAVDQSTCTIDNERKNHEQQNFANLNENFKSEEKVVNELRHDFNRFSAKWM